MYVCICICGNDRNFKPNHFLYTQYIVSVELKGS